MAQIILQILAVLGILLLCLLGLCLTLILLILFVPVRYRISGRKDGKEVEGAVRVTWLLHLLSVSYRYPQPGEVIVRVAGIRVWSMRAGEKNEAVPDEAVPDVEQKPEKQEKTADSAGVLEENSGQARLPAESGVTQEEADTPNISETPETPGADRKTERKMSLTEKIRKLRQTIRSAWGKIKQILENIGYYRDLLLQNENRLFFGRCWEQLCRILRHMRPRVLRADLVIGTGEPDTTGYLLAVYGMLSPFLGNHINIVPDFNEPVLEGTLFAKGRVAVFVLLRGGGRILLDKQLHRLMGKLKREEK
ncbi:MAG: DUF2953 domain-containing protein [Lachnospiraceae bacterium]|nr:DUF2953 domain-containing protein [Lachnospiraceae bacterium]